jgi:hypothetical protein
METGKGFAVTPIVTATSTGRRWSPARARNARHASSGRTTLARGVDRTTDDEILDWVGNAAEITYHPVGTCKMGSDPVAVVDSRLRVHGIKGLRIADASIMPTLTSGNTDAPSTLALVRTRRRPRSPSRPSRRIPHHSLTGQCFGGVVVQIALGEGPVRGIKSGARCQG